MKASDTGVATVLGGIVHSSLPLQLGLFGMAVLGLLIYAGIALPAVWSAKAARRKAAADVLRQILDAICRR